MELSQGGLYDRRLAHCLLFRNLSCPHILVIVTWGTFIQFLQLLTSVFSCLQFSTQGLTISGISFSLLNAPVPTPLVYVPRPFCQRLRVSLSPSIFVPCVQVWISHPCKTYLLLFLCSVSKSSPLSWPPPLIYTSQLVPFVFLL